MYLTYGNFVINLDSVSNLFSFADNILTLKKRLIHSFIHSFIHSLILIHAQVKPISTLSNCFSFQIGCAVVAAFMHYFLLVVFAWMLAEGIYLYIMIITVFDDIKNHFKLFIISAYGKWSRSISDSPLKFVQGNVRGTLWITNTA